MEKKRSSNFSTFETNLLIKLVEDKKHVLDPQKLNSASISMKHGAWREITANFNNHSQIRTYRDEKALKKKYSNLKCDSKNWTALRTEALSKLSKPESYAISYQLKQEKPDMPAMMGKQEPTEENGCYTACSQNMKPEINDELAAIPHDSTETEASAEDTDCSSNQKPPILLDKESELNLKTLAEKRLKLSEEEAKLKMEILENEHREQMKFLKLKHDMTMKKLKLEQESCRLELDFLRAEVAFRNKIRKNAFIRQKNNEEDVES